MTTSLLQILGTGGGGGGVVGVDGEVVVVVVGVALSAIGVGLKDLIAAVAAVSVEAVPKYTQYGL